MLSVLTLCTDLCLRERTPCLSRKQPSEWQHQAVAACTSAEVTRSANNTPSFKTHDDHDVHMTGRLQLLTNMTAGTSTAS
jgi:hypothetical protein